MVLSLDIGLAAESGDLPIVRGHLLNQNPDPAKAGDVVELRVRVQNTGQSEARNLLVEVAPDYPFTLLAGEARQQTILSLPNWPEEEQSKTLTYKVRVDRDAIEGQYEITFRFSSDGGITWVSDEYNIDVTSKEFAEIIYIDKTKLMPGKETQMTFTINNIGNAPLQNMVFSWEEPDSIILPVGSDNTRYIKFLGPGESIPLKYTVVASVNANPDLYALDLNLEYDVKDETGSTQKKIVSTRAGIFVGGKTDFDVTFSESSQGQTSLSIANVGSNPALSVTVRVPSQQGFRVQGSTDAIVGNLDKGDYTIVSFQISQASGAGQAGAVRTGEQRQGFSDMTNEERQQMRQRFAGQNNNLQVVIDYTDTTGERQSLEKTVPIQFRSVDFSAGGQTGADGAHGGQFGRRRQSTWTKPSFLIPLFLLIVVIMGTVYYRKKKEVKAFLRKLKKD